MAVVAFNEAKTYYEEKHDKDTFVKNIVSDNILLGDIYTQAKELHFVSECPRAAFLVRQLGPTDVSTIDVIQNLFPDKQTDFVISINESDVALIKQLPEGADVKELQKIAKQISAAVTKELGVKVVIGISTVVSHIRDLARAYKEAGVAIDVGKVFETEKTVINYENLGIGRLIYQLPTILCQMFLQEVFKKNPIDALDQETLLTINKFFENNLNVSETSRKLFVHRNTLVYRLEKIKKITGLDLREFEVLMARHACQYVRPDVCAVGGITTSKKICALAEAHDVLVIPHNPLGPVSTAACLQICASIPNMGIQELPGFCLNGAEDRMVKEPLRFENGCMLIPEAPGIGVELADDAEELYPANERGSTSARRAFDGSVKDW